MALWCALFLRTCKPDSCRERCEHSSRTRVRCARDGSRRRCGPGVRRGDPPGGRCFSPSSSAQALALARFARAQEPGGCQGRKQELSSGRHCVQHGPGLPQRSRLSRCRGPPCVRPRRQAASQQQLCGSAWHASCSARGAAAAAVRHAATCGVGPGRAPGVARAGTGAGQLAAVHISPEPRPRRAEAALARRLGHHDCRRCAQSGWCRAASVIVAPFVHDAARWCCCAAALERREQLKQYQARKAAEKLLKQQQPPPSQAAPPSVPGTPSGSLLKQQQQQHERPPARGQLAAGAPGLPPTASSSGRPGGLRPPLPGLPPTQQTRAATLPPGEGA